MDYLKEKKLYDKTTKKAMEFVRRENEASGHAEDIDMSSIS